MLPDPEVIAEWKREYGQVFLSSHRGKDYIFRPLRFTEFDELERREKDWSSADAEEFLVDIALLWPEDFDMNKVPSGVITILAEEIQEQSGHGSVYKLIDMLAAARENAGNFRNSMKSFILAFMPMFKPGELDDMFMHQLMDLVALAEEIAYTQQISSGLEVKQRLRLNLKTPEEIEASMRERLSDEGNATVADPVAQKLLQAMSEG